MKKSLVFLLNLIMVLGMFNFLSSSALSQNLVKNGGFENRTGNYLPGGISSIYADEITKCLGDFDLTKYPTGYPLTDNRANYKTDVLGGCDGWYNPSGDATPDYYNRGVPYIPPSKDVSIPKNRANNFGLPLGVQAIQQPSEGINGTAYFGIYNKRKLNILPTSGNSWCEYISQRLNNSDADQNFLHKDHWYHIKFRVSLALGNTDPDDGESGQYLKSIKAYFTHDKFQQNQMLPFDIPAGSIESFNLRGLNNPLNSWLDQTGGISGTNWMTVEEDYHPAKDMHYLTIGNFQGVWRSGTEFNGGPPLVNDWIRTYYFIDGVEITEKDPNLQTCYCYDSLELSMTHSISTEPILEPIESNQCCSKVYLTTAANVWNICHTNLAKVYRLTGDNFDTEEHLFDLDNLSYFQPGSKVYLGDICYNKDNVPAIVWLRIKLYDGNQFICNVESEYVPQCISGCESPDKPSPQFNVILTNLTKKTDDNCCWDVSLQNTSGYKMSCKNIILHVDPSMDQYIDFTLKDGSGWTKQHVTGSGLFILTNPIDYFPNDYQTSIGKICMNRGDQPVNYTISYSLSDNTICQRQWSGELTCPSCCTNLDFYFGDMSNPQYCCRWIHLTSENSPCNIYGWKVEQAGCCGDRKLGKNLRTTKF